MNTSLFSLFTQNWKSGLTVALVSIPLSVSLALASQTTPVVGIITAIWAGLVASFFGGSNFNIIGPTGALSGLLATYALKYGAQSLSTVALVAGVFILIAYALKLERYLVFIPASTMHGFTLGVACIIALNQINFVFGLTNVPAHEKLIYNVLESGRHLADFSGASFTMFALFLSALFIMLRYAPTIPGIIVLSPIGILLGFLVHKQIIPFHIQTLGERYGSISSTFIQVPTFSWSSSLGITGITIALIAIIETLISAKIADGMTHTKHDRRKEMMALGLANIACGITGGMPATAALARTALNIKSGATHKMSGIISSCFIALMSLILLRYFTYLPLAVIAAFLIFVALRMVEREHFSRLFKHDKKNFFIALLVALVCIIEDPILGILLGTSLSSILFMEQLSHGYYEVAVHKHEHNGIEGEWHIGDILIYSIKGELAYINSQAHIARFEKYQNAYKAVIISLSDVVFIDGDGIDAMDEIISLITERNMKLVIAEVPLTIHVLLEQSSSEYRELVQQGLVFKKVEEALQFLKVREMSNISSLQ